MRFAFCAQDSVSVASMFNAFLLVKIPFTESFSNVTLTSSVRRAIIICWWLHSRIIKGANKYHLSVYYNPVRYKR